MNIKIAFVVFEPHFSGQGRAVVDICNHVSSDIRFFLICQKSNGTLHEYCRTLVHGSLPMKISKLLNFEMLRALRFLKYNNVDLIHLHGFEGLLWGHALAAFAGIPIVYTPHTIDMKNKYYFFFFKILWKICSLYTSMLITVSEEDRATIARRKTIRPAKLRCIEYGINRARFDSTLYEKPHIEGANGKRWIVQVGHLSYQKNPFCFVRAAEILLRKFPDCAFLFVGEGPLRNDLISLIRARKLESSVHVLGYREDALAITQHAGIIVNTSRWEGMPFTLIDACFLGKPIVASAVNGTKDLIKEGVTGLLFKPDAEQELAQKMHILLCHESLRLQLGAEAQRSVAAILTPEAMGQEHESAYKSVLEK